MVHPPAESPLHGLGDPVVEKGILAGLIGMVFSEHIHQSPCLDRVEGIPHFRVEADVP